MERGDLLAGTYRIIHKLGQGGVGSVFLGLHERTCQLWAVKEVTKSLCRLSDAEVKHWKHFTYPGIPRMMDVLEEQDMIYFIMEYIPGKTLQEILKQKEKLTNKRILDMAGQLCEILEYLHSRAPAIIHGDLKPANIICREDGKLVVVDFGASRTTDWTGVSMGTGLYAAPELKMPEGIPDERSDIYSLGVILYRLYYGRFPLKERNKSVFRRKKKLAAVIERCLQEEKEARYSSCIAIGKDLKKSQTRMRLLCGSLAVLAMISLGIGSIWTEVKQSTAKQRTYENYLESSSILDYKSAIFLAPDREEAYLKLLQIMLLNNRLEPEEDILLRSILNQTESEFQKNPKGYLIFAWELGMTYWYYYEDSGNKKYAALWFQKIVDVSEKYNIDPAQRLRASAFAKIGMYYEELGKREKTGDISVSYKEFWEDIVYLSRLEAAEEDNVITALHIWNEIITLQYTYMWEFQKADVTEEEMNYVIEQIQKEIGNIQKEEESESVHRLKAEIEEKLQQVKESTKRLYGKEEQ